MNRKINPSPVSTRAAGQPRLMLDVRQNMKLVLLSLFASSAAMLLHADPLPSDADETTPMPGAFDREWRKFYFEADGEGSITPNLMEGGTRMVPAICVAVSDRKMRMRRYAIGALGHLGDRRAILTLEAIYADSTEDSIFRGDALEAIFCIDQELGKCYARQVLRRDYDDSHYLKKRAIEVLEHPERLLELWTG